MNSQFTASLKETKNEDEVIASYKILQFIRETTKYILYTAVRQTDNKPVIIKSVSKAIIKDDSSQLQFQREVDSLFYLQSPLIIEFIDFFSDKHHYYLVFERLPTLQDYINDHRKLKEIEASSIFTDLLLAVKMCHAHGIALRSMNLNNIYVTHKKKKGSNMRRLSIKLCCFEYCTYISLQSPKIDDSEITSFTAPEQFSKTLPRIDNKSDIWSLGIILYMMLTGCQPWDSSNPVILKSNINKAKFSLPYWISEPCREIIEGMIKVKPLHRLSIDDALRSTYIRCSCENPTIQRLQQKQIQENSIKNNYMFYTNLPSTTDVFSDYKSPASAFSSSSSQNYFQIIADRPLPKQQYDNDGAPLELIREIKSPWIEPVLLSIYQPFPVPPSKSKRTQANTSFLSISAQSCLKGVRSSFDATPQSKSFNTTPPKKNESRRPTTCVRARPILENPGNRKKIARSIDVLAPDPLY